KLASQEYEEREDELVIQIPPGPHLGDLVVRAEGVKKAYGDNLLFEGMNFDLPKGGIVVVIGPNGPGKTTLFRIIVRQGTLDVDTLLALEDALINFGGCAVVISHDRWFLDRIATHVLAFEGDSTVVWCEGNYQVYEEQRHARLGAAADQPHRIKYRKLHQ